MTCANCGNELRLGEKFCARCGTRVPVNPAGNGFGINSQTAPGGYSPAAQPQTAPTGYQPAPPPQAAPPSYQPEWQSQRAPTGFRPDMQQPQSGPTGFQPDLQQPQPQSGPAGFQPDAQPQAGPASFQPDAQQPQAGPASFQPDAQQPQVGPAGFQPDAQPQAEPAGFQPDTQPQAEPAGFQPDAQQPQAEPAGFQPDAQQQPQAEPAGFQPDAQPQQQPQAEPTGFQPDAQPHWAPPGFQPDSQPPQPQAEPASFQPDAQPHWAPAAFQPGVQPPGAPAGFQPDAQPHWAPPGFQPDAQPPWAPPGFQPGVQPHGAPAGFQPGVQPPGAQPPGVPEGNRPKAGGGNALSGIIQKLKGLPLKKILMIAVPAVVVIVALIIAIPLVSGSGGSSSSNSITFFEGFDEVVISANNNPKFTIDGSLDSVQRSLDGSKAVVLADKRGSNGGTLWFVTTSGSTRIAEDVVAFQLSDSGNGVVYLADYSSKSDIASMYLYDTSSKKASLITEDAPYQGYGDMILVCISPNGKSVGYVTDYDQYYDEFTGYMIIDGKAAEKLGNNSAAVAVSDGGKYLYYVKNYDGYSGSLNVSSGGNDRKLIPDFSGSFSLTFNKDYSQVVFDYQDKSYICRNGGEKEKIGNSTISGILTPRGTRSRYSSNYSTRTTVYGVGSLTNQVAYSDDGLVYINKNLETSRITSTSSNAYTGVISSNGKTLLFISNSGHLSAIDPTRPGAERRDVAKNVQRFVATNDAKSIYYVNDDDELWFVKGNGQPEKISDDVSYRHLVLPYNSNKAFFLVDYGSRRGGELYFSSNGGRRVQIPGADEVVDLWSTPANMFFQTLDDIVYRSNGNESFIKFAEEVSR